MFLTSCQLIESKSITLICEFGDHSWGKVCNLVKRDPIRFGTEESGYKFSGLTTDQRNEVRVIQFYTHIVDFIPKEALDTFPKLQGIDFSKQNIQILDDSYLRGLLKLLGTRIKWISFYHCNILVIEPKVLKTFKEKGVCAVDFNENICVNGYFQQTDASGCLTGLTEKTLKKCFDIFENWHSINKNLMKDLVLQNSIVAKNITLLMNETKELRKRISIEEDALNDSDKLNFENSEKMKQNFLAICIVVILLMLLGIVIVTLLIIAIRKLSQKTESQSNEYQFEGYDIA